jgi:hypothetical protein
LFAFRDEERKRGEREHGRRNHEHIAPPRQTAGLLNIVAKERGDRHVMGAAERPERECECHQNAERGRKQDHVEMDAGRERQRNELPEEEGNAEWQERPEHEADRDACDRDNPDLGKIDREYRAAGGADRFQGRDIRPLAL